MVAGHLSAAKSIKNYIEENYKNNEVILIDCIEYINKFLNKITTKAYTDFSKNARWIWKRIYSSSDNGPLSKVSTSVNRIMSLKLNRLIQKENPYLIISTHPFSSQMCAILKRKGKVTCKVATIMTDYVPHNQWLVQHQNMDVFFVAHDEMKNQLIAKGIDESKVFATGIPLSNRFLSDFNKAQIFSEFNLLEDKKTILFFAGGEFGFGKDKTFNILKSIVENYSDLQVIAIAGRNEKMKERFEQLVQNTHTENRIKILPYTNKVPELMSISDLVITKPGGLTTTESLASGLPLLIIDPLPGQEEGNATFIEQSGAGIWLKNTEEIKIVLDNIFNTPDKLQEMKKIAISISKRNSTKNICDYLLK